MDDPGPGGLHDPPLLPHPVPDESLLGAEELGGQSVVLLPCPEYILQLVLDPAWLELTVY